MENNLKRPEKVIYYRSPTVDDQGDLQQFLAFFMIFIGLIYKVLSIYQLEQIFRMGQLLPLFEFVLHYETERRLQTSDADIHDVLYGDDHTVCPQTIIVIPQYTSIITYNILYNDIILIQI